MKFVVTSAAAQDVAELAAYTIDNFPHKAAGLQLELQKYFETIALNPGIGRVGPRAGVRQLPMRNYPFVILFRSPDEVVEILRIYHTKRDPKGKVG